MRLTDREANPLIYPQDLLGRMTHAECEAVNRWLLGTAFYEISDIVGSACFTEIQRQLRAQATSPGENPFDLSMHVSHMGEYKDPGVFTVPGNVAQIHNRKFDLDDPETRAIFSYISGRCSHTPTEIGLALEIRGEYPPETIAHINATIDMWREGYGYTSGVVRPPLSAALQSAVVRTATAPGTNRASVTITDTEGPGGKPIVIHSAPGHSIRLSEDPVDHPYQPIRVIPTTHYLMKELEMAA